MNVSVVLSVPAKVSELLAVRVLPLAIVSVADVAGAVIAILLMEVADATPSVGVASVGLVARTTAPEPVDVVAPVPPWTTESAVVKAERDVMSAFAPLAAAEIAARAALALAAVRTDRPAAVESTMLAETTWLSASTQALTPFESSVTKP